MDFLLLLVPLLPYFLIFCQSNPQSSYFPWITAVSIPYCLPDRVHKAVGSLDVPAQVPDVGLDSFLLHGADGSAHVDGGDFVDFLSGIGAQVKALGAPGSFQTAVCGQKKSRRPFKDSLLGGAVGGWYVFDLLVVYPFDKLEVIVRDLFVCVIDCNGFLL